MPMPIINHQTNNAGNSVEQPMTRGGKRKKERKWDREFGGKAVLRFFLFVKGEGKW
jgi:hypothetical protein